MARSPTQSAPLPSPKKSASAIIVWTISLVVVLFFFPAMVLLIVVAMIPSGVAFMVDKSPVKYATICVASMNFCGAFPSIVELWDGPNNISQAVQMIGNILELSVIYAAAAFGWLIYKAVSPVIAGIIAVVAQHRIAQLRGSQRDLIQEWGESITEQAESGDGAA